MRRFWKSIRLQLRLQILIQGSLVVVLVAAQLRITGQFEQQILNAAEERAIAVADGVINGLNTMMITKSGDGEVIDSKESRRLFFQKMGASENVRELRVIRAAQLDTEYPQGLPEEYPLDDMDSRVLASGRVEAKFIGSAEHGATLRSVVPFIAMKNFRTIDCLKCHDVPEGAVLGAASVTIDVNADIAAINKINAWIWVGQGALQALLFLVIGLIVRRLSRELGGEPSHVIEVVGQIAKGNLSQEISTRPGDSTSVLAAVKKMQQERKQQEESVRKVTLEMETILSNALVGIVYLKERRIMSCNRRLEQIFGYDHGELLGLTTEVLYDSHETYIAIGERAYANLGKHNNYNEELMLRKKDGSLFWGALNGCAIDPTHPQQGSIWIYADISARHRAEQALKESRERFDLAVRGSSDGIWDWNIETDKVFVSDRWCEMLGYQANELNLTSRDWTELLHPDDRASALASMRAHLKSRQPYVSEYRMLHKSGEYRWFLNRGQAIWNEQGRATRIAGSTTDINERKKTEQELERLAQTDGLTGLTNRRHFMILANQELSRTRRYGSQLSLLMMDIDHFKGINDTHGHQIGDRVLQLLSRLCKQAFRDVDIVGRIGGEEFAVILPETDRDSALEVAERVRATIANAELPREQGLPLRFTVSIGVTTLVDATTNVETLLSQADQALYEAKHQGRNRVCRFG